VQLSLAGEESIQQKMCMQFIETPLWQRVLDVLSGGEGDLDDTQIAPGSMESDAPSLSPDLLPGLYMAGPMLADICSDALLGAAAGVPANLTMADLAVPLVKAMQRCYLTDTSGAEAVRCLYALPTVAVLLDNPRWRWQQPDSTFVSTLWDKAGGNGTLVWLLQTSTPAASKGALCVCVCVRLRVCAAWGPGQGWCVLACEWGTRLALHTSPHACAAAQHALCISLLVHPAPLTRLTCAIFFPSPSSLPSPFLPSQPHAPQCAPSSLPNQCGCHAARGAPWTCKPSCQR
jgi:hypothetical protein